RDLRELSTHLIRLDTTDFYTVQCDLGEVVGAEPGNLCDARRCTDHVLERNRFVVRNQVSLHAKIDDPIGRLTVIERADGYRDRDILHAYVPIDNVTHGPSTLHIGLDTYSAGRVVQGKRIDEDAVLIARLRAHRHPMAAVEVIVEDAHVLNIGFDSNV